MIQQLFVQEGADTNAASISNQHAMAIFDLLAQNPQQLLIFCAPVAILAVMLIVMIVVGFRGNRMYMKHCLKTIHNIQSEGLPTADYNVQLQTRGNVNVPLSICILVCYFIVTWLPRLFL